MKLINAGDLAFMTSTEIAVLIREASESLEALDVTSPEYSATISSITLLKRALSARRMSGPKL